MDINETKALDFFNTYSLEAEKIPESTVSGIKNPDFKVFSKSTFVFFAEVKTLYPDTRLDEKLGTVATFIAVDVNESAYNKIASNIKNAGKQFTSANPNHEYPNVLVFIDNRDCGVDDLHLVLEGIKTSSLSINVIDANVRAQMQAGANQIEAYVWLDNDKSKVIYNPSSPPELLSIVRTAFRA